MASNLTSKQFQLRFLMLASLVGANSASAIELTKNFYLPTSVDYDSNIPMLSVKKQDVTRFILNPRLALVAADELNTYNLDTSLFIAQSSDQNVSQDRRDPTADIAWLRSFERGQFSVAGHYSKASVRTSELTRSGVVFSDESSINRSLNANLNYALSERFTLGTGLGYQRQDFTGTGLSSFNSKNLNFKLSHLYSEKLSPFYQVSFNKFTEEETGNTSNSRNISVGANYLVNSKLSVTASLGVNRIDTAGSSWIGASTLTYNLDDNSSLNAAVSRSVAASGLGGFQNSDNLSVGYIKSISQLDRVGVSYVWDINRSINDARFMQLSGWYDRELSRDWTLRFTAQQRNLKTGNQSANGSQVGVSLVYSLLNF
jgi:hypothetical protein